MEQNEQPAGTLIADTLSAFAGRLTLEAIPGSVRERARHLMLDAVGVAHASTGFEFSQKALSALASFDGGDGDVIGLPDKLALRDAVLMNGILVHGIDYDDTYLPGGLHVTASCFPTALAMAARAGASGRELLTAYVLGVETACRLSAVARGKLHLIGFHPTGLIASFGCALTAGKLLGMNAAQLTMAQGITLSTTSCSSREYSRDSAWSKRIHPGWAGVAGITSAVMAQHGFIGPRSVYEGRYGLFPIHLQEQAAQCDLGVITAGLGEAWELDHVAIKPYPIGQLSVAGLDCAIAIAREHALRPSDVESVRVLVPKEAIPIVCEPLEKRRRPATGYAAQFSLPYAIACGLVRRRFGLAELEPSALADRELLAVAEKVGYEADPRSEYPRHYSGELIVKTRDGHTYTHREHVNRGAAERPLTGEEISGKFMANATRVISRARAQRIHDLILGIEQAPDARKISRALARDGEE